MPAFDTIVVNLDESMTESTPGEFTVLLTPRSKEAESRQGEGCEPAHRNAGGRLGELLAMHQADWSASQEFYLQQRLGNIEMMKNAQRWQQEPGRERMPLSRMRQYPPLRLT